MRVGILFNPSAGRGRGQAAARDIGAALRQAGVDVLERSTRDGDDARREMFGAVDAIVIAGGDGTLHHALPMLVAARVPVYHAAMGTENLFAREFGHSSDPARVARSLARGVSRAIDVGEFSRAGGGVMAPRHDAPTLGVGEPTLFAIMLSLGPDASVVHRVAARRRGPIRHWSYLGPMLDELREPHLPLMTVHAGGATLAAREAGGLIIANLRQYALRIDPLSNAACADGMLDVLFVPADDLATYVAALAASRARLPASAWGGRSTRASSVLFEVHDADARIQADGDPVNDRIMYGNSTGRSGAFWVRTLRSALRVCVA